MKNFEVNKFYKIDNLIELARRKVERDVVYMIYVPRNTDRLHPGMDVYVGDMPDFDEDDNEVFPDSIIALGLETGYMRDSFQDVIDLAYKQKPSATIDEVIQCLNHYDEYDDFLDLN